jgi:N-acetylneuraminate synthase
MSAPIQIGEVRVGPGEPTFVVAEIGINHNGDLALARKLIDAAKEAGCNAVKFQKRTPEICVPAGRRDMPRETPWGVMSYLDYRKRLEFSSKEFQAIDAHCKARGIPWFASCWDVEALESLRRFDLPAFKIASACLTDDELLLAHKNLDVPLVLSTGMSTLEQMDHAVKILGTENLLLTHCTSAYPCPPEDTNLRMIQTLRERYEVPVGYSGHETGLQISVAAVSLGACLIERHLTLNRALWGTDQAASVEPHGMARLVRDIRVVEKALGDGEKQVYDSEKPALEKLRRF